MTNYDDGERYWGNLTAPIMLNSDHRFSARSVKLVGDGKRALQFMRSTHLIISF